MDDCLIIGAGVVGLSLAYELAGAGLKVHLLDRQEPGQEASWAGAGILPAARRHAGGSASAQLAFLSRRLHGEWSARLKAETGIDTGYIVSGEVHVARAPKSVELLRQEITTWRDGDLAVEELRSEDLLRREPALDGSQILAACRLPDTAQVRNPRHLKALLAACRIRGVRVTTSAEVKRFTVRNGRIEEAITPAGRFNAERFVLCGGAWTAKLLEELGHRAPLMPIRGQIVLLRLPRPIFTSIFHEGPHYLVPRDDGRVLVGSTVEDVGFDKRTTPEAIAELLEFARSLMPALVDAEVERSWAGLRPGSLLPDPLIGPLPGWGNVLVAAGHFRWGLYLSTGTALLLRQLIRGETPIIDPADFCPRREQSLPGPCGTRR